MEYDNQNNVIPEVAAAVPEDTHFTIKIPKRGIKKVLKYLVPGMLILSLALNYVLVKMLRHNRWNNYSVSFAQEFGDMDEMERIKDMEDRMQKRNSGEGRVYHFKGGNGWGAREDFYDFEIEIPEVEIPDIEVPDFEMPDHFNFRGR